MTENKLQEDVKNLEIDKLLTDLHTRDIYATSKRNLMNPNLTSHEEVDELIYTMERLGIPTIKDFFEISDKKWCNFFSKTKTISKEKLELFKQKLICLRFVFVVDVKGKSSSLNVITHNIKQELFFIRNSNSENWSPAYKRRYDRVLQVMKLITFDNIEVLMEQVYNNPLCLIPLDVLKEASMYLKKKHEQTHGLFDRYWNHVKEEPDRC